MEEMRVTFEAVEHVHQHRATSAFPKYTHFSLMWGGKYHLYISVPGWPEVKAGTTVVAVLRERDNWKTLVGWVNTETGEVAAQISRTFARRCDFLPDVLGWQCRALWRFASAVSLLRHSDRRSFHLRSRRRVRVQKNFQAQGGQPCGARSGNQTQTEPGRTMTKLKLLLALAIALVVSGCAARYTIQASTQGGDAVSISDLRPVAEREGKALPFGRDFSHGILADSSFQPDRISILKAKLHQRFGTRLNGKDIELRMLRTIQYTAPTTPLDALIFRGTPLASIGIPDASRSWFITSIGITIDGKMFEGFSAVQIPPGMGTMKTASPQSVLRSIDDLVSNVAAKGI